MEFLQKPPQWLTSNAPDGVRSYLEGGGWYAVLGVGGLLVVVVVWIVVSRVVKALGGGKVKKEEKPDLDEDLEAIPAPPALTGDRRLTVEGVPVRLRLVVIAPAGRGQDINPGAAQPMLERVVPGLGKIAEADKPQVRVWPFQLSYEGFANQFHRNIAVPEGEGEPTRWVLVAGRAQLGNAQIMLGLGLQAVKPTTVGRLRLDKHEWTTTLRIRTRD